MLPFSSAFNSTVFLLSFILLPSFCVCALDGPNVPSTPDTPFFFTGAPRSIAVVGNPGTGKSTILNGLVGRAPFQSGPSLGFGLTKRLQSVSVGKVKFYDTPGLNDVESRTEAAAEIDKLLAVNGPLSLVFVVTLQNGRVREEDTMVIETVLNAIDSNTNGRFGVIVNQLSTGELDMLLSGSAPAHRVLRLLTGRRHTTFWHYLPIDDALVDVENGLLESAALKSFIERLPETRAVGAALKKVDVKEYEEKLEALKRRFTEEEEQTVKEIKQEIRKFSDWNVMSIIVLPLLSFVMLVVLRRLLMVFVRMMMRNWNGRERNKVFRITVIQCDVRRMVHCDDQECREFEEREKEQEEREKGLGEPEKEREREMVKNKDI